MNRLLALLFISFFVSVGCQTNELRQYEKLKLGMDKDEVLNVMGSPVRSERKHGLDQWTFRFYHQDQLYLKQVNFTDGKASYIGEPLKSEVAAEEVDRANEANNRALEEESMKKKQDHRTQSSKYLNNEDEKTKIRYVPQFRPVE